MKLGILGSGMIVHDFMRTIHKLNFEAVYVLGREETRGEIEQLISENHLTKAFYDYDELLASDVDIIYVALPNFLHYNFAKKALEHEKHVIVEKPAVSTARQMTELAQLAISKKRMLFEAMNIHYIPSYKALKEDLKHLGQIKMVSFNYSQYSSRYDAFKQGTVLPAFDPHKAGGALMDINVYNVHGIVGLFGIPKNAKYHANMERGIDTSGMMFYDYGTFKAVSIGAKDCKAPTMSTIQGDQAVIIIEKPINQMTEYKLLYNDGREELRQFGQTEHRMYYEFVEFIRMIEENDFEGHQKMLDLSCGIADLMTRTRREEGVVFDND